jgi:hypothetical protein
MGSALVMIFFCCFVISNGGGEGREGEGSKGDGECMGVSGDVAGVKRKFEESKVCEDESGGDGDGEGGCDDCDDCDDCDSCEELREEDVRREFRVEAIYLMQ